MKKLRDMFKFRETKRGAKGEPEPRKENEGKQRIQKKKTHIENVWDLWNRGGTVWGGFGLKKKGVDGGLR